MHQCIEMCGKKQPRPTNAAELVIRTSHIRKKPATPTVQSYIQARQTKPQDRQTRKAKPAQSISGSTKEKTIKNLRSVELDKTENRIRSWRKTLETKQYRG